MAYSTVFLYGITALVYSGIYNGGREYVEG
jgi:hypothetical protein